MVDNQNLVSNIGLDALMPGEITVKAENIGVRKVELPFNRLFPLALLAGTDEPESHAADSFLPKPVKFSLLQQTIDEVMGDRDKQK